ncbi:MAG: glycosyltransferase, partial [Candidatus Nomurabacteria bacterium]|nr:glycosyltransferase [Candidatus Nomurabacteria bacterium]
MTITVAIPHYNDAVKLERLLNQLSAENFDQILVLEDASTEPAVKALPAKFPAVEFVFGKENLGPGGNRNRALCKVKSDLIWFLDSDRIIKSSNPRTAIENIFQKNLRQACGGLTLMNGAPQGCNYGRRMHPTRDTMC